MKFNALRHGGKKKIILIACACFLLIAAAGTTVAWLTAQSALMTNNFQKTEVTCEIVENFDNHVKKDVSIRNTGDIPAFIRVTLVPVWKDGDNVVGIPASLEDCSLTMGSGFNAQWVLGKDGYYYCISPIPEGRDTPILIKNCTAETKDGYEFELQIAAQAVQALPAAAVEQAWGCGVGSDGKLEVEQ